MRFLHCECTRPLVPSAEIDIRSGGIKSTDKQQAENPVGPCAISSPGARSPWLPQPRQRARPEHRTPPAPSPNPNEEQTNPRYAESPLSLRKRPKANKTGLRYHPRLPQPTIKANTRLRNG